MLSVALVRSAGGAANYFAADNYYTRADADRSGEWLGEGARQLGLEGEVDPQVFEALLRGELTTGERIGGKSHAHRAGVDLTFSMPKSWSLIALVGGDKRVLDAYRDAVKETLGWAERNAANARIETHGKERVVPTGKLVVAMFQHDTMRHVDFDNPANRLLVRCPLFRDEFHNRTLAIGPPHFVPGPGDRRDS